MAERKTYKEIVRKFLENDEVVIETRLDGERAGEKKILTSEEAKKAPKDGWHRETLFAKPKAVLLGGGHVSLAIAQLLKMVEFRVIVVDEREEFANKERFCCADEVYCMGFQEFLDTKDFGEHAYYIIVTRGHKDDYTCLSGLLRREKTYIGMIGSRKKVAISFDKLRAEGYLEEEIAQVHAPIGLAIGAQTPAEIAVSIAAEIIQKKNESPKIINTLEEEILKGLEDEKSKVLVTVIEKKGSSPRGEGTKMIVREDGKIYGTIGGGAVEHEAIEEAKNFDAEKGFLIKDYDLSNAKAATLGMVCGGQVKVMFERL